MHRPLSVAGRRRRRPGNRVPHPARCHRLRRHLTMASQTTIRLPKDLTTRRPPPGPNPPSIHQTQDGLNKAPRPPISPANPRLRGFLYPFLHVPAHVAQGREQLPPKQ